MYSIHMKHLITSFSYAAHTKQYPTIEFFLPSHFAPKGSMVRTNIEYLFLHMNTLQ